MFIGIATAELHVEHGSVGVTVFRREGPAEEIAGAKQVGIEGAHRSTCGAQGGKVVGGADRQSVDAPEQSSG